ncbi:MAG: hypothetical protein E7107_09345 [Prevotella sp.]|nr:hypothetical protein [Prevotella sp.]
MSTAALNNLWTYIKGLSLSYSDRQWLAEHLVEPEEIEHAKERKKDEQFVREMRALQYEGQPTAEEMKRMIRESHYFDSNKVSSQYADEE